MGRPPLPVGTAGRVRAYRTGSGWRARTTYRDYDGVTREVQKHGTTRAAALRNLAVAVRDRVHVGGGEDLKPDSRVSALAEAWFADLEAQGRAAGTLEQYRYNLDRCLLPGLGNLRVRELTVSACDRYLRTIEAKSGASTAKISRSVLSGACGLAARRDLLSRNPVRDTGVISAKPKKAPESLSVEQILDLRTWLTYDELAIRRDIPDVVAFMLACGMRIGEVAAVHWRHVDLEAGTVEVAGNVVRVKGKGLIIQEDDSSKLTRRTLELPSWAMSMLRRRAARYGARAVLDEWPVFPAPRGGLRDPKNTNADMRDAFDFCGYDWVTSHVFRKTVATLMDEAGLSSRAAADQLGHAQPSMTQNRYFGRRRKTGASAVLEALDLAM